MMTNFNGLTEGSSLRMDSLRSTIRLTIPINISVLTLRSCASSIITIEYLLSEKSLAISRSRIPSVINLMAVLLETLVSNRI